MEGSHEKNKHRQLDAGQSDMERRDELQEGYGLPLENFALCLICKSVDLQKDTTS